MKRGHRHRGKRRRPTEEQVRPGASPGWPEFDPQAKAPLIRLLAYGPDSYEERELERLDDLAQVSGRWPVIWINVDGVGHAPTMQALQRIFGLHALALEDVIHVGQRPKIDDYDEHVFVVLRMPTEHGREHTEQVSLFVGRDYVLTFQEECEGDCFDPVRARIRAGKGQIRRMGPDYLAYALLDSVIDSYFPFLFKVGEQLEELEAQAFGSPDKTTVARIQGIRSELRELRRAHWPHHDVVSGLLREETPRISAETRLYLRDCADHAVRVSELIESYREESSDLMNAYLSTTNNRMGEVMKVLTMVASIFIPLSFIASIYGMNFHSMPELGWKWGYPFALGLMGVVGIGLVLLFRKKGWLG